MTTAPEDFFAGLQAESRAAVSQVAAQTGAGLLDLRPFLCTDGECSTRRGQMALYGDPAHISVDAGIALIPEFRAAVERAVSAG